MNFDTLLFPQFFSIFINIWIIVSSYIILCFKDMSKNKRHRQIIYAHVKWATGDPRGPNRVFFNKVWTSPQCNFHSFSPIALKFEQLFLLVSSCGLWPMSISSYNLIRQIIYAHIKWASWETCTGPKLTDRHIRAFLKSCKSESF